MNLKEKLIASLFIIVTLIITCCTQSCSTANKIHKNPVDYQKFHQYTCPAFNS